MQSRTKKLIALGPCVHDWVGMCSVGELDNGHNAALCVHVFDKKELQGVNDYIQFYTHYKEWWQSSKELQLKVIWFGMHDLKVGTVVE